VNCSAKPTDSPRRRAKPAGSQHGPEDAACWEQARRIQDRHRNWVVMWSAWRQTFTAFGCFAPDRLVLDEPTTAELLDAMRAAELHHCPTITDGLTAISP